MLFMLLRAYSTIIIQNKHANRPLYITSTVVLSDDSTATRHDATTRNLFLNVDLRRTLRKAVIVNTQVLN